MWNINDRVHVVGYNYHGKVVDKKYENGEMWYLVREFSHPHTLVWISEPDLEKPYWKTHDEHALVAQRQEASDLESEQC